MYKKTHCKQILCIISVLFILYGLFKVVSCNYYGVIVYKTFRLTPWDLFDGRENYWNGKGYAKLINFVYRVDGYVPNSWGVDLGTVELSQVDCNEIYHIVQKLLLDSKHSYEIVKARPGVSITFWEKAQKNDIRLSIKLSSEGFWIDYHIDIPFILFPLRYPVTICCGPHVPETLRLWECYGNLENFLPLSNYAKSKLKEKRRYHPLLMNVLDETLLEKPVWEPSVGVAQ